MIKHGYDNIDGMDSSPGMLAQVLKLYYCMTGDLFLINCAKMLCGTLNVHCPWLLTQCYIYKV